MGILSRIATSRTLKEAFEPPYRGKPLESFSFGLTGIEGLLEQPAVSFSIEADVELSPTVVQTVNRQIQEMKRPKLARGVHTTESNSGDVSFVREKYLRYRIEIEMLPRSGILRVENEYLAALTSKGKPTHFHGLWVPQSGMRDCGAI